MELRNMDWFFNRQTQSQWNAAGLGFLTARCRSGTAASDDSGSLTARVCTFIVYGNRTPGTAAMSHGIWFFNRQTQSQWNAAGFGFLTARCRSGTDANGPWSGFLTARAYATCSWVGFLNRQL